MLKIRLQKVGKKNAPSYRVVLAEHTAPPQGKFIEILGHYNPRLKQKNFKKERIEHWLSRGAQASPTIHNLLVDAKIIEAEKLKAWRPKKKKTEKKEEKPKEAETLKEESKPVEDGKEEPKIEEKTEESKSEEKTEKEVKEEEKKEESKHREEPVEEKSKEEAKEEKSEEPLDKPEKID